MTQPQTVSELIELWPSRRELADEVGDKLDNVHKWAQTNRIPSWKQASVLEASRKRGLLVDADWMLRVHAEARSAPNARGAA